MSIWLSKILPFWNVSNAVRNSTITPIGITGEIRSLWWAEQSSSTVHSHQVLSWTAFWWTKMLLSHWQARKQEYHIPKALQIAPPKQTTIRDRIQCMGSTTLPWSFNQRPKAVSRSCQSCLLVSKTNSVQGQISDSTWPQPQAHAEGSKTLRLAVGRMPAERHMMHTLCLLTAATRAAAAMALCRAPAAGPLPQVRVQSSDRHCSVLHRHCW